MSFVHKQLINISTREICSQYFVTKVSMSSKFVMLILIILTLMIWVLIDFTKWIWCTQFHFLRSVFVIVGVSLCFLFIYCCWIYPHPRHNSINARMRCVKILLIARKINAKIRKVCYTDVRCDLVLKNIKNAQEM